MNVDRKRRLRAAFVAALCFTLAVPLVAALLFFPVMMLAGAHSDLLPNALQPAVLLLGWLSVVAVPAWCARAVYGRLTRARATTKARLSPIEREEADHARDRNRGSRRTDAAGL